MPGMSIVYGLLVVLHLIGMAAVVGSYLVTARAPKVLPDYFAVLATAVRAAAAAAVGDRDDAAALYPTLLPYEDRFAGGSTAAFAFCPVASVLADCAELLGDREAARRHHLRAAAVARAWEPGGEWERRALAAADRLSLATG